MAIYHLSGTLISRSQGRSAVASSAYRSGERLYDERYQKEHNYTRKSDVVYKEILLPKDAPAWMADREKLWNAVEASEKRKDAQLSREFNFALPRELSLAQNTELAKEFVQTQFVNKGMVADLCIHADKNPEGEYLHHAHVMLTLREVIPDGFGPKVRAWNDKSMLLEWREAWAESANRALALNGHDLRIDHRTLEAQGIALEPQTKIGPTASQAKMVSLGEHQRIARENGEKLLAHPHIALKALTQQQSTFTYQDIARFVSRHTVDAEQFSLVYEAVQGSKEIVRLGLDEQQRERLSTQEILKLETNMLKDAKSLAEKYAHPVLEAKVQTALESRDLSREQKYVLEYLMEPEALRCIVGYAGTGKSYLLGAARETWEESGYRVLGATLSGIAAQTLEGSSGIKSRTLASRCYYWDRGQERLSHRDILVIDEAGMLGSRQVARVVQEVEQSGAKLVLVGDMQQLQAIQAGAAFRAIVEQSRFVELTEIRRQSIGWQADATKAFAKGEVSRALGYYDRASHLHEFQTQALAKHALIELWNDARLANPSQTQIILAYTKADVQALNEQARELRKAQGELGREASFMTARGERPFAENDRIYFLKNDRDLGVMNGTLGTVAEIKQGEILIWVDNLDKSSDKGAKRLISVNLNFYNHLEQGYAATIHKAQGVTVDRSYLLGSKYFDAHSAYVGMSRHRVSMDFFWSKEEFPHYQALVQTLGRDRTKDITLDYVAKGEFSTVRGLEQSSQAYEGTKTSDKSLIKGIKEPSKFRQGEDTFLQKHQQLREFKARFEKENPETAKKIQYDILPTAQKAVIQQERQREQEAQKVAREHELAKAQEREQAKALEREQTLQRQRSREIERGGFEIEF